MRFYLFVLSTLMFGCSFANDRTEFQQRRIIEVQGVSSVISVPDLFSFNLSIKEKGREAAELNKVIGKKTNEVVQALFKVGVDKNAIQSLQVQFNPWIEYKGNTQEQKGFILTRQVKITLNSLAQYERAIDAVLNIGVSNINQFSFSNSQNDENYQSALKQALLNARQRATDMAKVLDLKLGSVISISELSTDQLTPIAFSARQSQISESYQAGEMSTEARVKVLFALQDGS
jgi:uncharacterized protein YggE